jgi:hypothetical protein
MCAGCSTEHFSITKQPYVYLQGTVYNKENLQSTVTYASLIAALSTDLHLFTFFRSFDCLPDYNYINVFLVQQYRHIV